jgi:hypothetical protein
MQSTCEFLSACSPHAVRTSEYALGGHGRDPLPCVDVSMNDYSGLRALATTAPDVDACQCSSLNRGTDSENLRLASVTGLQVLEELYMVGIWVVGSEPGLARNWLYSVFSVWVCAAVYQPA